MDNLDKIKFKYSIPGYLFKIDNSGKTEFKEGTLYIEELKAWEALGNTIEPQYTVKELAEKEAEDSQNAINSQRSICIQLLNDSEKAVSNDPPYPDDIELWKTSRQQWRDIIKGNVLSEIPKKPF